MGEFWGSGKRRGTRGVRAWGLVLGAGLAVLLATAGCTVAPPVQGSANLPDGPGTITVDQGPIGPKGFCLPSVFALSYVAQDTPTAFTLTITASPSMCETVNPIAVIYAMPKGATNIGNAWPQKLAATTPFTIKGPGVTTVTFHKGCLPAQFDVVYPPTPPVITPFGGPFHGPQLFPFPWAAGAAGLWYGSQCPGGGGCDTYTVTNLAVKPTTASPGDTITVSGNGTPGTTIAISFRQPPAAAVPSGATVKVPANGEWSLPVTVPTSLTSGTWQVVAGVEGCEVAATADITIQSGTTPTSSTSTTSTTSTTSSTSTTSTTSTIPSVVAGTNTGTPSGTPPLPPASVESATVTNTPVSTGASLATTGSSVRVPLVAGLLLLMAGAFLLLQRRRSHSTGTA